MSDKVYQKTSRIANLHPEVVKFLREDPELNEFVGDIARLTRKWTNPKIAEDIKHVSPQGLHEQLKKGGNQ